MTTIILTSLLFQVVVAVYLFNLNKNKENVFEKILNSILIVTLLHLGIKLLWFAVLHNQLLYHKVASSFGFTYGPLLYFAYLSLNKNPVKRKTIIIHLIPFFTASILYIISIAGILVKYKNIELILSFYRIFQYTILISLFAYTLLIIYKTTSKININKEYKLIYQSGVMLISAVLIGISGLFISFPKHLDSRLLFYIPITFLAILIIKYKVTSQQQIQNLNSQHTITETENLNATRTEKKAKYSKSGLDMNALNIYEEQLSIYMQQSKIYLNPDLSLEILSTNIKIPKHHITQLLNEKLNKNFYQYINEFRIQHAIEQLQKSTEVQCNLLSLAYDCGFNSKSSFNNYFKKITGFTPSQFKRNNHQPLNINHKLAC